MKRIEDFRFSGIGALCLDLDEAPRAVVVDIEDGSVTLHEGIGSDRMNGVCVPGPKVIAFQVDTLQGDTIVRFLFHARDGIQSYILGTTRDDASAEAWVSRVNTIYRSHKNQAERVAEFRQGQFRSSPVLHDIIEERQATVLPGDYIYSAADSVPTMSPTYLEPWESFFVKRTLAYVKERTGLKAKIREDVRPRMPHYYAWLSNRVRYNREHYQNRITHPLELIFDRVERHDKITVIPTGIAPHFAVLYFSDNTCARSIHGRSSTGPAVAPSFEHWIERIGATADTSGRLIVCTPQEHSVDFSLNDAMYNSRIAPTQKVTASDITNLGDWLWMNLRQGIVACDVGEALQIRRYMSGRYGSAAGGLQHHCVPYEHPITVGICCRCDDSQWQEICIASIRDTHGARDAAVRESLERNRCLAQSIGIELYLAA